MVGVRALLVFLPVGVSLMLKALQHMPHESAHGTHDKHFCEDIVLAVCSVPLLLLSPSGRLSQHMVTARLNDLMHILRGIWHENNTQKRIVMNMATSTKNILDAINAADTIKKSSGLLRHCTFLGYPFSDTRGATFPPRGQLEHF